MKNDSYYHQLKVDEAKAIIAARTSYEFGTAKPGAYLGTGRNKKYWM